MDAPAVGKDQLHATVRRTVRGLLEPSPGFAAASPAQRRAIANRVVKVALMGADLVADDAAQTARARRSAPVASAQEFAAAKAAGQTFQDLRAAIDFPTYVQSLITGVFQAITQSNLQQITAIADMLDAVARTQDEFTAENIRDAEVLTWAAAKLPFLRASDGQLHLADGSDLASHQPQLRAVLQATDDELANLDGDGDLLESMGPLIRRRIGRERQQVLATMVQMGLQRVVVDEGRLHASMEMRIDARSMVDNERARREQLGVDAGVAAQFGTGMWGASAHLNVNFNKVEAEHTRTQDELAARAGLRSTVDLAFRTEQVPLDRMASANHRARLDANARVPMSVSEGSILSTPSAPALSNLAAGTAPATTNDTAEARAAREAAERRERERAAQPPKPPAAPTAPAPPAAGANPPATGANPPAAGANPPAAGANPPATGANPPATAKPPPAAAAPGK